MAAPAVNWVANAATVAVVAPMARAVALVAGLVTGLASGNRRAGSGQVPEHIIHEIAVGVQEVRSTEARTRGLDTEGLVEEVRHGSSDSLVIKELRGVLRFKRTLIERMGDNRVDDSPDRQLAGNPQSQDSTPG